MKSWRHGIATRALALVLCAELGPLACVPAPVVAPASGVVEFRSYGLIPVAGGFVDAVGGNLMLQGAGISLDTPLGTQRVAPVWNSASGYWQWSHRPFYDGHFFLDASGAVTVVEVADGAPIPGTGWTRIDASTLRTRGGVALHFRSDGSLEHTRWATLDYPRITFTPTQIAQCSSASTCAPLFTLENHANGQPLRVTDARSGRVAIFSYDAGNRLSTARSPEDVARSSPGTRYEYSGSQLVAATSSEGVRVEYAYQAGGRIRSVTQRGEGDPTCVFDFYGRNAWGLHRTVYRNPLGGHVHVYFDETRRVQRIERFEAGENITFAWQDLRPTRIVEADGSLTTLTWQQERVVTRVTPAGNTVHVQYAPGALVPDAPDSDPILRVEDSLGLVEARSYDALGRPISIQNGAGESRALGWNGASLVLTEQADLATEFPVFGAHGHWLDAARDGSVLVRRAFDVVGNEIVPPEPLRIGGLLGIGYDGDRRETSRDVAASDETGHVVATATIALLRTRDGAPVAIDRPGDGDHVFERDALGRVVRIRERSQGSWHDTRIEYDAAGNETARELANGMRQEWEFDGYGRMVRHLALRDGQLEGEETFTWQDDHVVARTDSLRSGGEVVVLDPAGRTASIIFGYGESISYAYDARNRVTRELYSLPGAGTVADIGYAYDGADRQTGVQDRTRGDWLVRAQRVAGRLTEIETGNGLRRSFGYDDLGRLASFETRDAQGALVEQSQVSRGLATAPPRFEIRTETTTPLVTTEERYWLPQGNALNNPDQRVGKRLFGWSRGSGTPRRYAWDELGNRTATSTGDSFGYDAERSRLLSASLPGEGVSLAYSYDAAGFVTSRGGVPLEWTALGRLARHGADTIQWDMAGLPIRIREGGATREFLYFGGRIQSSASSLGALDLGDVVLALGSGARRYRHFDFREQVSFVSNDAGVVVAHYRYQPFGVDAGFGPEAGARRFENRMAFSGLFVLGARPLDPLIGRFLAPDPVLQPGNQYDYAAGNPVAFQDSAAMDAQARADAAQLASDLMSGSKAVGFLAVMAGGGAPIGALLVIAAGLGISSVALTVAIEHGVFDGPSPGFRSPPRWFGPPIQTRVTIVDPSAFDFPSPAPGCAPLNLTQFGEGRATLLAGLLLLNAIVAAIWWQREGRRRRA